MDIFMPIAICVIFLILFSICGWCCKRKREGTVYGLGPNVLVTTQHTTAVPPYPVDNRQPVPQFNQSPAPAPGFATQTPPYPIHPAHPQPGVAPYPPAAAAGGTFPYPPAHDGSSYPPAGPTPYPPAGPTPYPPAEPSNFNLHPPPYDVAVSTPPVQPPRDKEAYVKQSPYNPNFS